MIAHGGTIVGRNRVDGPGAEFLVELPKEAPPLLAPKEAN